jgi:hypothetical protein
MRRMRTPAGLLAAGAALTAQTFDGEFDADLDYQIGVSPGGTPVEVVLIDAAQRPSEN